MVASDNDGCFVKRFTALVALAAFAASASAGPREQAKRMHDRIAGVPPSAAVLDAMEAEITAGRAEAAALIAMDNPSFYSVTLKNLVTPWTNREQTVFAPLNDYTATVIGMVRDDLPFNEVLSADVLYVGNAGLGLPAVSPANNDHYEQMETRGVNLLTGLQRTTQSGRLRHAAGRDRRRPDDARRGPVVLHRRHQPRDVPLHADELHVPRPGAGPGHVARRRTASART